jgi:hypothetical protein
MRQLKLVSQALEDEVAAELRTLEATVQPGPKGEHDLEVTFPVPFERKIGNYLVKIRSNKKIVIEVKSSQRKGAKLDDLRQTYDWVLRESRRIVSVEDQAADLADLETAMLDVDFRLAGNHLVRSEGELVDARSAVDELFKAVDRAVNSLRFRVKGLLVINHHIDAEVDRAERPLLEQNTLTFAKANHIAVISWQQLLEAAKKANLGDLDPVNFWSQLFDTGGIFEHGSYNWRDRASLQSSLFDSSEAEIITDARFLQR